MQTEIKDIAEGKVQEMKERLGELYENNEDALAYYVEKIAYCQAVLAIGPDEKTSDTLDYLKIGMESEIEKLSYETGEIALDIAKALLRETISVIIQAAKGSVSA